MDLFMVKSFLGSPGNTYRFPYYQGPMDRFAEVLAPDCRALLVLAEELARQVIGLPGTVRTEYASPTSSHAHLSLRSRTKLRAPLGTQSRVQMIRSLDRGSPISSQGVGTPIDFSRA